MNIKNNKKFIMSEKYIVTWNSLQIYVRKLAKKILNVKRKWESIIAVSRGGLIPAALLARELSIRIVDTICIASYVHNKLSKNVKILKTTHRHSKNVLIVDDLVDTGRTARIIKNMYPESYFVTIFSKPKGKNIVDQYIVDILQNTWIEQPWDTSRVYTIPLIQESKIK